MKLLEADRLIKPGRALFSAVGLKRCYDPKPGPLVITKAEFAEAVRLEPQIHDVIGEFLDGKREGADLPKVDLAETEELLFRELDPQTTEDKLAQFKGHPGGDDFAAIAGAAKNYLKYKIPRRLRKVPAFGQQPINATPSRAELIAFRRHLATAENPVWAMQNLLAATLGRDHLEALQTVWPDALAAAQLAARTGLAERLEKDPAHQLPRRIARQLAVLLGEPSVPDDFVQLLQESFAGEEKDPQAGQKQPTPTPDDRLETIVQKNAAQR